MELVSKMDEKKLKNYMIVEVETDTFRPYGTPQRLTYDDAVTDMKTLAKRYPDRTFVVMGRAAWINKRIEIDIAEASAA